MDDVVSAVVSGLTEGSHMIDLTWGALFRVAVLVLVGMLVIRVLMRVADRMLERSKALAPFRAYARSVLRIFLWFLLALMAAGSLNIDVTSIIALLSVAGLAVSLALQNTLSNLAGGMVLLGTKPFQVGDFVEADGVSGTVSAIDLFYTTFVTYDNKEIFLPNSQLSAAKIVNYTALGTRRVDLNFTAAYEESTPRVKEAIQRVLDQIPRILDDPPPAIRITGYQASRIQYTVRAWAAAADYWDVYNAIQEGVREEFVRQRIDMAYDRMEVHMLDR